MVVVATGAVRAPGSAAAASAALAIGLVALGMLTFVNGVLAARGDWFDLALMLTGDAVLRTGSGPGGGRGGLSAALPWAIAVGGLAWLPLMALRAPIRERCRCPRLRPGRRTGPARAHRDGLHGLRRAAGRRASPCCSRSLRGHDDLTGPTGVLLATLVLVRSPLLVVIYGLRPAIMRAFLDEAGSLGRGRGPLVAGARRRRGSGDAAGRGDRADGGPGRLRRPATRRRPADLAALTGGSVLIALLVVSGLALVAADRHTASTAGWLASLLVSASLLLAVPSVRRRS